MVNNSIWGFEIKVGSVFAGSVFAEDSEVFKEIVNTFFIKLVNLLINSLVDKLPKPKKYSEEGDSFVFISAL